MQKTALEQVTALAFFLYHLEKDQPNATYGSHHVGDAFEAVAFIMQVPADALRKACGRLDAIH